MGVGKKANKAEYVLKYHASCLWTSTGTYCIYSLSCDIDVYTYILHTYMQ